MDSKAECDQLYLAYITKNKKCTTRKLKQKQKLQCPLSSIQVQVSWRQSGRKKDYGGKIYETDEF